MSAKVEAPLPHADRFIDGVRSCTPTLLGYLGIGFSARAVGWIAGLSLSEIALMSLLIYAGSGQFVVAGMFAGQAQMTSIWLAVFIVNLRHVLLSSYVATLSHRMTMAQGVAVGAQLTDETFGVAAVQGKRVGELKFPWMLGVNSTAYLGWLAGNLAGAGASIILPQRLIAGLGFALVAMFIGLVVLQISASRDRLAQICAGLLAAALWLPATALAGSSFGVITAAVAACSLATGVRRWKSGRTSR